MEIVRGSALGLASHCGAMVHQRKIVVYIAASADGFIARSDGSVDWLDRPRPKGNYDMSAFYKSIDTILWGGKTYDMALHFQKKGVAGSGRASIQESRTLFSHGACCNRQHRRWSS
jgi:hypothetical protein